MFPLRCLLIMGSRSRRELRGNLSTEASLSSPPLREATKPLGRTAGICIAPRAVTECKRDSNCARKFSVEFSHLFSIVALRICSAEHQRLDARQNIKMPVPRLLAKTAHVLLYRRYRSFVADEMFRTGATRLELRDLLVAAIV